MNNIEEFEKWYEKVRKITRIPDAQLLLIFGYKNEGKTVYEISKILNICDNNIYRLFDEKKVIYNRINALEYNKLNKFVATDEKRKKTAARVDKYRKTNLGKSKAKLEQEKQKIVTVILNEIKQEPTELSKSIWSRIGIWSRKYDVCVECNSNLYIHWAKGMCCRCYKKLSITKEQRKKYREKISPSKYSDYYKKAYKKRKELFEKIKNGEIQATEKAKNLLEYHSELTNKQ